MKAATIAVCVGLWITATTCGTAHADAYTDTHAWFLAEHIEHETGLSPLPGESRVVSQQMEYRVKQVPDELRARLALDLVEGRGLQMAFGEQGPTTLVERWSFQSEEAAADYARVLRAQHPRSPLVVEQRGKAAVAVVGEAAASPETTFKITRKAWALTTEDAWPYSGDTVGVADVLTVAGAEGGEVLFSTTPKGVTMARVVEQIRAARTIKWAREGSSPRVARIVEGEMISLEFLPFKDPEDETAEDQLQFVLRGDDSHHEVFTRSWGWMAMHADERAQLQEPLMRAFRLLQQKRETEPLAKHRLRLRSETSLGELPHLGTEEGAMQALQRSLGK